MKKSILLTMTLLLVAFAVPNSSEARDEGWAALGGLVGGLLISDIQHNRHSHASRVSRVHHAEPVRRGHYEFREEKSWVPGCWKESIDDCGHVTRYWEEGYNEIRSVKVWVPHRVRELRVVRRAACGRY